MTPVFAIGTLVLLSLMYWGAYHNGKEIKNIEIRGNLLLQFPELVFKLLLFGLCMGLASSLNPSQVRLEKVLGWPPHNFTVELVAGVVLGLVSQFFVNILAGVAVRIWGTHIYSPVILRSVVPRKGQEWFLIIIPLLLSVLVEEVLFRGLAIGGFSLIINPWLLAIASSILFGLVHVPQGILGMILVGLVGFIFAAAFIISNSLLLVISAHFVINLLQIIRAKEEENWLQRFQKPSTKPDTELS